MRLQFTDETNSRRVNAVAELWEKDDDDDDDVLAMWTLDNPTHKKITKRTFDELKIKITYHKFNRKTIV